MPTSLPTKSPFVRHAPSGFCRRAAWYALGAVVYFAILGMDRLCRK